MIFIELTPFVAFRERYYWHVQAGCIYLVYGYAKARREDLTAR
jgi:hypothetical protein